MAPYVFISYARKDADFALKLGRDLREKGIPIWLDQLDILPGQRWDRAVEQALESCARLLVSSRFAPSSPSCLRGPMLRDK